MPLVLGVDSSAANTTVEVRDADTGRLVAAGTSSQPPVGSGAVEQDPAQWWRSLLGAVAASDRRDIASMAVAAQQQTVVVTDSAGAVLRPALLAEDRRARRHAVDLVEARGVQSWIDDVGSVPGAGSPVAKLAWLASAEPETFRKVGHVLGAHDWLTFRLTGRMVTDRGDASDTGLWSPRAGRWRTDALRRLDGGDWLERLPTVLGPTTPADWLTASVHEIVGLRGRPIVAAGTGRSMAAVLSMGLGPAEVGVTLGAAGGVFAVAEEPVADASGRVRGLADATGRFLPTYPLRHAAAGIDGVARLLGADADALGELAVRAPSGAGGVTVVPATPTSGAAIHDVGPSTTRELVARATFEGLACAALDGIEAIVDVTGRKLRGPIHLAGVAARSVAFRRILADLAGVAVLAATEPRPVARGACIQAAAALAGCSPSHIVDVWGPGDVEVCEPAERVDVQAVRGAYRSVSTARRR